MLFQSFDWFSGHGIWAIIPCPTNVVKEYTLGGKENVPKSARFRDKSRFLIKTIIPLVLVGYEMIIANKALHASLPIYSTAQR